MTLDELNKYVTEEMKIIFGISSATDLYQLAFIVSRLDEGPILEIGTWLGRTAYAMAMHKNTKSILHLVDPFESNFTGGQPYPQANLDIYRDANSGTLNEEFLKLKELIYEHNGNLPAVKHVLKDFLSTIEFHKTHSEDFELTFEPKFAFIDGGHIYQDCYGDLKKVVQYDNTLIAVHDYDQDDVKKACDNIVQEYNRKSYATNNMFYILDINNYYEPLIIELLTKLDDE